MAEIRQLLNIIEQLEKKLGLEAGHSMRLRLEKDSLSDMLKKSSTFDAWDRMMSSGKSDSGNVTPTGTSVSIFCLCKYILFSKFFEFAIMFVFFAECTRNKFAMCFFIREEREGSICLHILLSFFMINLSFPMKYMIIHFSVSDFFQRTD